jgi:hypothetical protein
MVNMIEPAAICQFLAGSGGPVNPPDSAGDCGVFAQAEIG